MTSKIEGCLEVGTNERGEVVINLDKDRNGVGHIVFSPEQALSLGKLLIKKAGEIESPLTYEEVMDEIRKSLGYRNRGKELADRANISPSYVYDILAGRRRAGPDVLRALGYREVKHYLRERK